MKNWQSLLIDQEATIRQAVSLIDKNRGQFAVVVDQNQSLLGTVTDGDIRRAIIRGVETNASVVDVMTTNPVYLEATSSRAENKKTLENHNIKAAPVIDKRNRHVVSIMSMEELSLPEPRKNTVILMAGGLGSRLMPLTQECPKPLLQIGGRPILETILKSFINCGFSDFYVSVNYKADMIKDYFGDGERYGINISYLEEDKRMGTAGALSLLDAKLSEPVIIMNGDILTNVDFARLVDFHLDSESEATMCVRQHEYQIPYGVIKMDEHSISQITEKPTHKFFVNAGIYVLQPSALNKIPRDSFYDMPTLFDDLIQLDQKVGAYPIREYWLDIGRIPDFEKANQEFEEMFV